MRELTYETNFNIICTFDDCIVLNNADVIYSGRPGQSGINVVSGNFFYSAKPFGVRQGVDYQLTGEVRKVEVDNIKKRLESGDVVLLTSLGYSPSGEVFNCQSESLAAECAARLSAAKIIYLTRGEVMYDTENGQNDIIQNLRLAQAIAFLEARGVPGNSSDPACLLFNSKGDNITTTDKGTENIIVDDNCTVHSNVDQVLLDKRRKSTLEEFLVILSRQVLLS